MGVPSRPFFALFITERNGTAATRRGSVLARDGSECGIGRGVATLQCEVSHVSFAQRDRAAACRRGAVNCPESLKLPYMHDGL